MFAILSDFHAFERVLKCYGHERTRRDGLRQPSLQNSMLFRLVYYFMLILAILGDFPRVLTRLEVLGTQEDTGGMGYGSHPSNLVCHFEFLPILC
jgi:hypothetical protein